MFEFTDYDFESNSQLAEKLARLVAANEIDSVSINLSLIDCANPKVARLIKKVLENPAAQIILFRAMVLNNIQLLTDQLYAAEHLRIIKLSVYDSASRIVFFTKLLSLPHAKVINEKYVPFTPEKPVHEKHVAISVSPRSSNTVTFLNHDYNESSSDPEDEFDETHNPTLPINNNLLLNKPKKKVSFADEKQEGKIRHERQYVKNSSAIYTNYESVNKAANLGDELTLTTAFRQFGSDKFNTMLSTDSEIPPFEGYKTLHFAVEGRSYPLIKLFHRFGADFLVKIKNPEFDTNGFIPFQLAVYKTDARMMLTFSAIEDRTFKTMLHHSCTVGKYLGYQALHIALAKLTDQENVGGAPIALRQNMVDMLIQWGADRNFRIYNPNSPWHGKNATEILEELRKLRNPDATVVTRSLTP